MSFTGNIRKTISYAARNGLTETWYAAKERIRDKVGVSYIYEAPALADLQSQRELYSSYEKLGERKLPLISILVPLYNPNPQFLREMLESVLLQTFQNFELILADGTPQAVSQDGEECDAETIVASYRSEKFIYKRLSKNGGISWNTNQAAAYATGDYIALLDYDDVLTPDALYEVTQCIRKEEPEIIYSDEDKCDEKTRKFFEPNIKPDFNADYFLTNNYICHFLVMKTELFQALKLRPDYDGAQDYDLLLRAPWSGIRHIPKVLYHWRTHSQSTAGNPGSKNYAYEAGRRALEDHFRTCHIQAVVSNSRHNGFFNISYQPDIFTCRPEVGVVGGKLLDARRRIVGGMMSYDGTVAFYGMHEMESGPMHRADTMQDAEVVDVRCMEIRDELRPLYLDVMGTPYDAHVMKSTNSDELRLLSIDFCRQAAEKGYLVVFDPSMTRTLK